MLVCFAESKPKDHWKATHLEDGDVDGGGEDGEDVSGRVL